MAGGYYDAPNQQAVRADGSAPWDEGSGGGVTPAKPKSKKTADTEVTADTAVSSEASSAR